MTLPSSRSSAVFEYQSISPMGLPQSGHVSSVRFILPSGLYWRAWPVWPSGGPILAGVVLGASVISVLYLPPGYRVVCRWCRTCVVCRIPLFELLVFCPQLVNLLKQCVVCLLQGFVCLVLVLEFMINRPKNKIRKICQIFY